MMRQDSSQLKTLSKSSVNIQIPFTGTDFRVERKLTLSKLIRVLLGLVVLLTFVANILFILETKRMNTEGEKPIIGHRDIRRALPRSRDAAGSNVVKVATPSK